MPETDINSSGFPGPPVVCLQNWGEACLLDMNRWVVVWGGSHSKAAFSDLTVDQTTP